MKGTRAQHLETLLVICLGMVVLYLAWDQPAFLWVGLGLGLAGLIVPMAGRWIHFGWTGIGHVMGWINSYLLLGVLFFVVLTPIALLRRLVGRDPMQRAKGRDTQLVVRDHTYEAKDLEDLW